jgi:hypothetical protein
MSGNHLITRDNADNVWVAEIQNFQISDNTPPPPPPFPPERLFLALF